MFLIGKASAEEIEQMKAEGWEVEEVDVAHFDKAFNPKSDDNPDRYEEHDDKLVSVFIDQDIGKQLKKK
jgi:hypothetical protein